MERVPVDVVPVPVLCVEVDEIGEDQAAIEIRHLTFELVHSLVVACRVPGDGDAPPGEQIFNLADRHDHNGGGRQTIEQRLAGRR